MYEPKVAWLDRNRLLDDLERHAKRHAPDYVKQHVEEFLEHAGITLVTQIKVMDSTSVCRTAERPIIGVRVSDAGKKIRLFCFGGDYTHHGAVVQIELTQPVEQHDLRSKESTFNAQHQAPAASLGRSQKPPYRNGGPMKAAYIAGK